MGLVSDYLSHTIVAHLILVGSACKVPKVGEISPMLLADSPGAGGGLKEED
jgi:hypothetical protein